MHKIGLCVLNNNTETVYVKDLLRKEAESWTPESLIKKQNFTFKNV